MRSSVWAIAILLQIAQSTPQGATAPAVGDAIPMNLVGDADILGGRLRLTPAMRQTVGAAWFSEKKYVQRGFDAVFRFQITDPGGLGPGADGFAFVLQNAGPDAIGGRGSAGGFALGN